MMKNLYIPKGKTLHYETLSCQNIVNDGVLVVEKTIRARNISGKGILDAGTISARHVGAMDIECAAIVGETLAAERVCAAEVTLSGPAVVSCYLEAEYVNTPKLTVGKSSIGTLNAPDVVNLPEKKRGITSALAAGFFRRLWLALTHRVPVDAPYVAAGGPASEGAENQVTEQAPADTQPQETVQNEAVNTGLEDDFEFKRLKAMYCLLKDCGYTLRLSRRKEEVPLPEGSADSVSFPHAA